MVYLPNQYNWQQVLDWLQSQPKGAILRLRKNQIDDPLDAGAHQSVGLPMGQHADYRWVLSDCSGLHVRDFGDFYEAHIDEVDPSCGVVEHLQRDAPGTYVAGSAAIGALLGTLIGRSGGAALVGGIIGAAFGAVTLPDDNE